MGTGGHWDVRVNTALCVYSASDIMLSNQENPGYPVTPASGLGPCIFVSMCDRLAGTLIHTSKTVQQYIVTCNIHWL